MSDKEFDKAWSALQGILPEPLRDGWLILPRSSIHQLTIACFLLGAGTALLIAGGFLGVKSLMWGFPLALASLALATKFMPWWRRNDQLVKEWYQSRKDGGDEQAAASDGASRRG